ncbi:MAG: glycosyltransferase [Actinomycetes bacterium]|jgi:glycosyltransferase involved in cell wall biosynthesis|nr:glycosyltransferase [Actinomycetes bacterium]
MGSGTTNSRNSLNVLQLSSADHDGGAERVALDLHNELLSRGIYSTLVVGRKTGNSQSVKQMQHEYYRTHWAQLLHRVAPDTAMASQSATARVARALIYALAEPGRALRRIRSLDDLDFPGSKHVLGMSDTLPDVLHLHYPSSGYFDFRALGAISQHVPIIYTFHGMWPVTGHCAHSLDCDRWKTRCVNCSHLDYPPTLHSDNAHRNWLWKYQVWSGARINVVVPSRWMADRVNQSPMAGDFASVTVLPNGVNTKIFAPADKQKVRDELGLPSDAFVVLTVTALDKNPYKDSRTLRSVMEGFAELNDGLAQVVFIQIGGTLTLHEQCGQVIVIRTPYIQDQVELARYYQASDVLFHPAMAESFGLVIVEAQACGLPVVVADAGATPETLQSGSTGFLFPREDVEVSLAQLCALRSNISQRSIMGQQATKWANQNFTLNHMTNRYIDLYRLCVSSFRSTLPASADQNDDKHHYADC